LELPTDAPILEKRAMVALHVATFILLIAVHDACLRFCRTDAEGGTISIGAWVNFLALVAFVQPAVEHLGSLELLIAYYGPARFSN
jgi:hypothetical protein